MFLSSECPNPTSFNCEHEYEGCMLKYAEENEQHKFIKKCLYISLFSFEDIAVAIKVTFGSDSDIAQQLLKKSQER
jgi:hypothetical protein